MIQTVDKSEDLSKATDKAIKESFNEIEKIKGRVDELTSLFRDTANKVRDIQSSEDYKETTDNFADELENSCNKLEDLFERQKKVLSSFNIVLFGRTGAGKSTLISAITRSNGEAVSPGESDWTPKVEPREWHSCKIYDTPGINGWGRENSRESLEKKAREAVEIADFVLVCFDSQSQQADEFKKVADWVQSYKKPVIAILNPRNPIWRSPKRAQFPSQRRSVSESVQQHAFNIRDELTKIGLEEVPILAINSKRALFARATLPYKGPDAKSLQKQRKEYSIELLEEWSSLPRFEHLLVEVISKYAVEFRIGALNDQIRGVFNELSSSLSAIKDELEKAYEGIESDMIQVLFTILGYPAKKNEKYRAIFRDKERDLLLDLENLRDGAFQASTQGKYHQFISQRIEAEFGAIRSRSLDLAEERIISAFEKKELVTADEMRDICFDDAEIKKTAQQVIDEGISFLKRNLDLAMRDTILNLKIEASGTKVDGDTGKGKKLGSFALKGAGAISGAISALGFIAALNSWNPAGWVAAAVIGGGAIAAMALKWLGKKVRANAEKDQLKARRKALANIRRNIHEVYDGIIEEVVTHANNNAIEVSKEYLVKPIKQSIVLRSIYGYCIELQTEIKGLVQKLKASSEPQNLMLKAQKSIENEIYPERSNASLLYWLGEDWIEDPEGLQDEPTTKKRSATKAYGESYFDQFFSGLKDIFNRITEDVKAESGKAWLQEAIESCEEDTFALSKLSELEQIILDGKPRIYMVGDYNSGKSSFIRRLLIDAGKPVPDSLKVDASPETSEVREYDWNEVKLIDSPGFQSSQKIHAEVTMSAFSDASAVIFLFQPNLILGNDRNLKTILNGEEEKGLVPKKGRTFFIINRADELGADPEFSPDSFKVLVDRKKRELSLALESRGVTVKSDQIFCMSSDPYGLVGNRNQVNSKDFDPYRRWDGLNYFMKAFKDQKNALHRIGVDRSVLEGGVARMEKLAAQKESEIKKYSNKADALLKLNQEINESILEGRRLKAKSETKLKRLIGEQAAAFKEEILVEEDNEQLKVKAQEFKQWWNDDALQVEINQWANETAQSLNEWRERSLEKIQRRMDSAEFQQIMGEYDGQGPEIKDTSKIKGFFVDVFNKIGNSFGAATRDAVYGIGKSLGFKFKPWGAVKLAKNLGRAGAVMAVAGVLFDIGDIFWEEKRIKDREKQRRKLTKFLDDSVPKIVDAVAYGNEDDSGLLKQLEGMVSKLKNIETELTEKRVEILSVKSSAEKKLARYRKLKRNAINRL